MNTQRFHNQLEIGELSEMLAAGAESFCRHYFPEGQKQGNYWQMGDTSGSKGKSLVVRLQNSGGRKAGQWTDYATSEFGDLIDLLHIHLGDPNPSTTFKEVRAYLGETPSPARSVDMESPALQANKRREQARTIVKYSKSTYRTLAANYLFGRMIKRFGPSLRFHPSLYVRNEEDTDFIKRPALIAKITDNSGVITGCGRTFLNPASNQLADMESPKGVVRRKLN